MYNKTEQNQRNESRLHWSIKFAIAIGVLGFLTGCTQASETEQSETITPTNMPATATESIAPLIGNPTSTEIPTYIPANTFEIGSNPPVSLNQPFTVELPLKTATSLTWGEVKKFHMDNPLLVTSPDWDSDQMDEFNDNGRDNSNGNDFIVVQSDEPNHYLIFSHAGNRSSLGKAVYMAGYIESIGKESDAIGKPIPFNFSGTEITGFITNIVNIPTRDLYTQSNWSDPYTEPTLYVKIGNLGLSQDQAVTPGITRYYVTFVSCNYASPGKPSLSETFENIDALQSDDYLGNIPISANQTLVTVEFDFLSQP